MGFFLKKRELSSNKLVGNTYPSIGIQQALGRRKKREERVDSVDKAYAQTFGGAASYKTDADRVALLFMLYQRYTSLLSAEGARVRHHNK
jgi:hypothetical protein